MRKIKPPARPTISRSVATFIVLASVFLLTSCGGSGGGGSGTTGANRNLPPDPGAAATATVAGVDTNNNGVRDEVEIALSKVIASDADYAKTVVVAKAYQAVLISPSPTTRSEALKMESNILCAAKKGEGVVYENTSDSNYLLHLTSDTPTRKTLFLALGKKLSGGYLGSELTSCE